MPTYNLRKFKMKQIPNNGVVFCIGRRGSGKSTTMIGILSAKRHEFAYGIAFIGNRATAQEYYAKIMPATFIFDNYQPEVLKELLDRQERKIAEKGRKRTPFVYCCIDDCFFQRGELTHDEQFLRLLNNGRNYNAFGLISMHYSLTVKPNIRQQIDFAVLSREKNPAYRKRLYENYNSVFKSPYEFEQCMDASTKDYHVLILDNFSTQSNAIEDNVFWWKARSIKEGGADFKMNRGGYWWKFHAKRFDPLYYTREPPETATKSTRKKTAKASVILT
jgi:hypothetical protein